MTASAVETSDYELDRPLALYPLTYLAEGDEVTVGCAHTDSYGIFPADGAALVWRLETGMSPNAAAAWYSETYGEQVDVIEFIDALTELQFVAPSEQARTLVPSVRWQRLGRYLFGPLSWPCYAALLMGVVIAMVEVPQVRPAYANLFFGHYLTIIELTVFFGQVPLMLIHEGFHALAGRRLGLRSKLGMGVRLYYVVFETNLDGLVTVPKRRRYLPIMAGMIGDFVVFSVLTLVAVLTRHPDGAMSLVGGICLSLAFATVIRFIWQFYFYLRTDLYYLIVTTLGCVDLQSVAKAALRNQFRRLLGRPPYADESTWHPRDRAVARWYSWLLLAGYTFSLATMLFIAVPIVWIVLGSVFGRLTGDHTSVALRVDSVVFIGLNVLNLALIAYFPIRDRLRRRKETPLSHVLN
jgi:hypothetical protein